jgi:L-fuconolactonase
VLIVDAQLHEPTVSLGWEDADETTRRRVLLELQLGFMRAVGVDCAVLFPADREWGEEVARDRPDTFSFVPVITSGGKYGGIAAESPDVADVISDMRKKPGLVAMRISTSTPAHAGVQEVAPVDAFERALTACEREGLPVFLSAAGNLGAPIAVAERFPGLSIVIDNFGLLQPPAYERESPPFRSLPDLLALARHPNIAVKLSGGPSLSQERFPYVDLWPSLQRVVDAFGADRLMWGSDISRFYGSVGFAGRVPGFVEGFEGAHSYAEALLYLRDSDQLSAAEKSAILGGTAQRLLGWPPAR